MSEISDMENHSTSALRSILSWICFLQATNPSIRTVAIERRAAILQKQDGQSTRNNGNRCNS